MDETKKFINMIEAFECDFLIAEKDKTALGIIQEKINDKDEDLMRDIELLKELSFLLRNNKAKIIIEK